MWATYRLFLTVSTVVILLLLGGVAVVECSPEKIQDDPENSEGTIVVEDYLESLSIEDLKQICMDRGMEIRPDTATTKADYVEAARRCLSLEDEMNAILAANPELAAEIEAEVERMKNLKEELERERETMLREKEFLEKQLRDAGIDIKKEFSDVLEKPADSTKDPASYTSNTTVSKERDVDLSTFQGVLKESFILLFERVSEDMKMLWKLFGPVLRPLFETISSSARLIWRHLRPKSNINREL